MKKYLFAALALTALVACSKDDDPTAVLTSSEKSVTISIANMASGTRASNGAPTSPATEQACTSINGQFHILFLDENDKLVTSFTGTQLNTGTYGSAGAYTFNGLPATVKSIIAAGNFTTMPFSVGNEVNLETLMPDEATVMNLDWSEISNLPVYDKQDLTPVKDNSDNQVYIGNYAAYEATLNIAPRFARIEITQISCTNFGDATLGYDAIGVQKISLHGNATANDTDPANDKYVIELNTELDSDDELNSGSTASSVLKNASQKLTAVNGIEWNATGGKVWSWNIEPQDISNLTTSLYVSGNGYTPIDPTRTVTINSYITGDPADEIDEFKAGNIYRFAINFSHTNMDSEGSYIVADVDVTIADWVVNEVTPGFATGN